MKQSDSERQTTDRSHYQNQNHQRFLSQEMVRCCPIDIPNQFLYDKIAGQKFQQFLEGQYTAEKLVQDMNIVVKQKRLTKEQLEDTKTIEERLNKQKKIKERYNKVKSLIQNNIKQKESLKIENNLKSSKLFSTINYHCEDHAAKIRSKDLLSERIDGIREYDSVKYRSHKGLGLKINTKCYTQQQMTDIQYSKHIASIELHKEVEDYFHNLEQKNYINDQKTKRKAKLKIMSDRKQKLHFIEFEQNKNFQPSLKDVQLYNYIHGNQINSTHVKSNSNLYGNKRQQQFHAITNFNVFPQILSLDDCDQSFASMKEMKLTKLYSQSIELQKKMLTERKLVHKLTYSKQIDNLVDQIQINNQLKLR